MRFLLIDNFDSFTYNLVHYFEREGVFVDVVTNLNIPFDQLDLYDGFVLSPGPGLPATSGDLMQGIEAIVCLKKPVLGVCLGMQALAEFFGDTLYNQQIVKHGMQEEIVQIGNSSLFKNVPERFAVGLYHSWAVEVMSDSIFTVTSSSEHGVIMSMENAKEHIYAVQFHPESILTPHGTQMIHNFVELVKIQNTMHS